MRNFAFDPAMFGGFRQSDEGTLLGHELGLSSAFNAPNYDQPENRFNRIDNNQFQAGDVYNARGMAPPELGGEQGGFWRFAGSGKGMENKWSSDDSGNEFDTSQWIYEMPQQQAAPQQREMQQPQQREFVPPALDIYDETPEGWDRYRNIARAEAEGLNRMPFTFAGTEAAYIPTDKQSAFEMFYPSDLQGYQNYFRNPLLESDLPPLSMDETGVSKSKAKDPFLTEQYTNPLFR
jgi:hypothetical protein